MYKDRNPMISVIVPVYNVSSYLNENVESIVAQIYENLEIILVDDGSTDESGELCDIWVQKDPRIRVIHQKNSGLSAARNAGLEVSAGEYIMFCDSDDVMSSELCQVLLDAMSPEVGISVCDCVHIFPNQTYSFEVKPGISVFSAESAIQRLWYQTGFLPSAWAKLYRRSVFSTHRFTPDLYFEDVDILHELLWTAGKVAYTPSRLYGYRHRENSITMQPFSEKEFDILRVAQKILAFAQDKPALIMPAQAYATTAAFRIYLRTPREPEYLHRITQAECLIRDYGKNVLRDRSVRRKNRYALYLYYLCKPLLFCIYKHIDRWKE